MLPPLDDRQWPRDSVAETEPGPWHPASFESWRIRVLAPPLVAAGAVLVTRSPLGFFLQGFYVWVHEFGHATVRWLAGRLAVPLPFGWTVSADERSPIVYGVVLALLVALAVAGFRERTPWAVAVAVGLAGAQFFMTWRLPHVRVDLWTAFAGVGGEFYLSAVMMALFYVRLPEKFRWGGCRYFFLFVGAGCFWRTLLFWRAVRRGEEGIPYGSMIGGEDDTGGDMDQLHQVHGWTQRKIIHAYNDLGTACLWALAIVYLFFALGLDRLIARQLAALRGSAEAPPDT